MERGGDGVDTAAHRSPSQAVIEAVATVEGVSPGELRPPEYESLHAAIDPEALDALFADRANSKHRSAGIVSFTYCGYDLTVDGNGTVTVEERETNEYDG